MRHSTVHPSQRQLRVAEQLKHTMIETMQRGLFYDENVLDTDGLTITEVRVSPDLKNATAFISVLGAQEPEDDVLEALNDSISYFKKDISNKLRLKFMPHITFISDASFDNARHIEDLIARLPHKKQERE